MEEKRDERVVNALIGHLLGVQDCVETLARGGHPRHDEGIELRLPEPYHSAVKMNLPLWVWQSNGVPMRVAGITIKSLREPA